MRASASGGEKQAAAATPRRELLLRSSSLFVLGALLDLTGTAPRLGVEKFGKLETLVRRFVAGASVTSAR